MYHKEDEKTLTFLRYIMIDVVGEVFVALHQGAYR